jgi:proline iminopeptidase
MPGPHRYQLPGDGSAAPLIDGLTGLGRQVISFDPFGSGHSGRTFRLGMEEMHACADEALSACGVSEPVDAFGHSMAGLVLLAYALERPGTLRRIVLVGTGTGGPAYMNAPGALWNRSHRGFRRLAALGILSMLLPRRGSEVVLRNYIKRHSYVDPRHFVSEPVHLLDWFRPKHGRSEWHRIAVKLNYSGRLGEITIPTIVLCGRYDPQYPLSCSLELAAGIRQARLEVFQRSGHYPFVEEAEAFWGAVGRFLAL